MKTPRRQIKQHQLLAIDLQPRQQIEQAEQNPDRQFAPALIAALDLTRIDLFLFLVQVDDNGVTAATVGHSGLAGITHAGRFG